MRRRNLIRQVRAHLYQVLDKLVRPEGIQTHPSSGFATHRHFHDNVVVRLIEDAFECHMRQGNAAPAERAKLRRSLGNILETRLFPQVFKC